MPQIPKNYNGQILAKIIKIRIYDGYYTLDAFNKLNKSECVHLKVHCDQTKIFISFKEEIIEVSYISSDDVYESIDVNISNDIAYLIKFINPIS